MFPHFTDGMQGAEEVQWSPCDKSPRDSGLESQWSVLPGARVLRLLLQDWPRVYVMFSPSSNGKDPVNIIF